MTDDSEAILNVHLYPILNQLLATHDGLNLVNSEQAKWVSVHSESNKNDLSPDFAACYPWLFEHKDPYNTTTAALATERGNVEETMGRQLIYGKPFWATRNGIEVVFKTKVVFQFAGLGELLNNLAHICKDMGNTVSKGVLLWNKGFMLVRVKCGFPVIISKALWTSPGSKKLFEDFVRQIG